jgi:hypothetical protein
MSPELIKAQANMQQAVVAMAEIEAQLKGMCMEAGCRTSDELPEAERRAAGRRLSPFFSG